MKTFIWADDSQSFSEWEFFVAVAETLDEARILVIKQIEIDEEEEIQHINKLGWGANEKIEAIIKERQENYLKVKEIINQEPSHILSAGMAMVIQHQNE